MLADNSDHVRSFSFSLGKMEALLIRMSRPPAVCSARSMSV